MTARPVMTVDHLRLELAPRVTDGQYQRFELRLLDTAGNTIMSLKLRGDIAHTLASEDAEWQITMSPSGSVEVYNDDDDPRRLLKIGLDELIEQSLTADMLEDEPDLKTQLVALRRKLTESLVLVDRTLGDLDKPA